MSCLGAYILPGVSPMYAGDDPRMARLRRAWPTWQYMQHASGTITLPDGLDSSLDECGDAITLGDSMQWRPPLTLPSLHDLARDEMPQPATEIRLRRSGLISLPLGIGPVYGSGKKRGQPSSEFGILAFELFNRSQIPDRKWTDADERDTERLLFLAIQFGYAMTEELFEEMAPYDTDEITIMLGVIWGNDPKASASDGPTSPPSPPA